VLQRAPPRLVVAGHFHANVEGVHSGGAVSGGWGLPLEVVTTSAVGCAIAWNGSEARTFPHSLARAIASEANGSAAFLKYIVRNGSLDVAADMALNQQRVVAGADRSGVRLFEFDRSAGYRHRFHTLEELANLVAPLTPSTEASPLADLAFTLWNAPTSAQSSVS